MWIGKASWFSVVMVLGSALVCGGCGGSSNSASAQAAAKRKQLVQKRTGRITQTVPEQPLSYPGTVPGAQEPGQAELPQPGTPEPNQ
jgi:hypothetical protein